MYKVLLTVKVLKYYYLGGPEYYHQIVICTTKSLIMFSHLKTANVFQIFAPFDLCFATLCSRVLISLSVLSFMYSSFNSFFFH